jgi:hypothetical protein
VSYGYRFDELLAVLRGRDPQSDTAVLHSRRSAHGLLSIGLKIHDLGDGSDFFPLVEHLGGASQVLERNVYKHARASLCLVLPPVGNSPAAIALLESLSRFIGSPLFGNRKIQIQVCSPGRLDARRSALLAIGFYLASDTLRRFKSGELETTVSHDGRYQRGRRLVLYDAGGEFDRGFEWWQRCGENDNPIVVPELPFQNARTDLLIGSGSRLDIENVNVLATLLVHAQYKGFWAQLGAELEAEMTSLLDRHLLSGLIDATWVLTGETGIVDDARFLSALQELVAYAFDESGRVQKVWGFPFFSTSSGPEQSCSGILSEMQTLLAKYRDQVMSKSTVHENGGAT